MPLPQTIVRSYHHPKTAGRHFFRNFLDVPLWN
jgi:hypothetical protein